MGRKLAFFGHPRLHHRVLVRHHLREIIFVGNVAGSGDRQSASIRDLSRNRFGRIQIAVTDYDRRPGTGKRQRDGTTDAGTRTGDQGNIVFKLKIRYIKHRQIQAY